MSGSTTTARRSAWLGNAPVPPSYPKKKHATGQARIKIDGRHRYLGRHGSPEWLEEFQRVLDEWRAAHLPATGERQGPNAGPAPTQAVGSIIDLCERFMAHSQQHYRNADGTPTTEVQAYRQSLPARVLPALPGSSWKLFDSSNQTQVGSESRVEMQ
jgi:hypothetical protein